MANHAVVLNELPDGAAMRVVENVFTAIDTDTLEGRYPESTNILSEKVLPAMLMSNPVPLLPIAASASACVDHPAMLIIPE